ncbi:aminoglycoside phosphotransferase family protein [Streptomyces sp. NPDC006976]|uniref:phosphotransferase family protein n=1 Tax=Streptomyces sp. NPDC006976 TaxID=3154311 RepID=UPI0033E2E0CC
MDFQPVERAPEASQQSLTAQEITGICRRAFGSATDPVSAVELSTGMYNNVYRLALYGRAEPVILRVAPEEGRQFRSEHRLMRNEYATQPWLTVIAPLMPRVLTVDWSHEVVDRDWMIQTCLPGVPAPERMRAYPRTARTTFFRQMGAIARKVHDVRGPHFGPVAGPAYGKWSEAVLASLEDIAADLRDAGLDASGVREAAALAARDRATLDEITEPRLMSGDLWTVNTLLDPTAPEPVITGVLDFDRTWFGDPAADWTISMATAVQDERASFWEPYGALDRSPAAVRRAGIYEARHLGAILLEAHRLGRTDAVRERYELLARLLADLTRPRG